MPNEKEKNVFKVSKVIRGVTHTTFKIANSEIDELDIEDKIHYVVTDRVLQISGSNAAVTVPALPLNEEAFIPKQ